MRKSGFTLLEAVIALSILSVVLMIGINYFTRTSEVARQAQTQSEVQDRVRGVMQVVVNDLQAAGSSRYTDSSGNTTSQLSCVSSTCLSGSAGSSSTNIADKLTVRYTSSLQDSSASACRRVDYLLTNNSLRRSDQTCATADATVTTALDSTSNELAGNILALDIQYTCSTGNTTNQFPDSTNCPSGTSFPRSALVTVVGRATVSDGKTSSKTYTTTSGQTVTCPATYTCYSMTQQVLMPNLKDQ